MSINQPSDREWEEKISSEVERRVILLLRQMRPYDRIEIKHNGLTISVVSSHTTKDDFGVQ